MTVEINLYLDSSIAASETTTPGPPMLHGLDTWHPAMRGVNSFLSLNHRERCVGTVPESVIGEMVWWEMYPRVH